MSEQPEIETIIGKYKVLELLGKGGYGTVYRAFDANLDVYRAIKILHPAFNSDPKYIASFRREAQIVAKIEHPNVVPVYELGQENGRYYHVMRMMEGGSLHARLSKEGAIPFQAALDILKDIAAALDFAHSRGLVHRDIKPANVLFEADGAARLSDFGFARAFSEGSHSISGSSSSGIVGTFSYMAPELFSNVTSTPASDLYSLGCLFTELLSGQVLFSGESSEVIITKHLFVGPKFPEQWPNPLPQGVEEVLKKALDRQPENRYPSAGAFYAALSNPAAAPAVEIHTEQPAPTSPPQKTDPVPGGTRKSTLAKKIAAHPVLAACLTMLAACLLLYGFWSALISWSGNFMTNQTQTAIARAALDHQVEVTEAARVKFIATEQAEPTTPPATPVPDTATPDPIPSATPLEPTATEDTTASDGMQILNEARANWRLVELDSFETNRNQWTQLDTWDEWGKRTYTVQNGKYTWDISNERSAIYSAANQLPEVDDFLVSTDVLIVNASIGENPLKLGYHFSDNTDGKFRLQVQLDGYFNVLYINDQTNEFTDILPWEKSSPLNQNGMNRLAVLAQGERARLYINDQYVGQFDDARLVEGIISPLIYLRQKGDTVTVEFDNFELRVP